MFVSRLKATMFLLIVGSVLVACSPASGNDYPLSYQPNDALPEWNITPFSQYVNNTQRWLNTSRAFLTDDKDSEVKLNSPFEWHPSPEQDNGNGVLLVHGLGDSPYSFHDIAKRLVKQGYTVRALLLPGHGTRPADLMLPNPGDWQTMVNFHVEQFAKQVNQLWLGGYSTGANLVTKAAFQHPDVAGLLLFSPAFHSSSSLIQYSGLAQYIMPWADKDPENNPLRYNSLPTHGAYLYYRTSVNVVRQLERHDYDKPTLMVLAEHDSILDTEQIADMFKQHFTHPKSVLLWQGEHLPKDYRAFLLPMPISEQKISTGSHMGIMFSPQNPYYGVQGSIKVCNNGQTEAQTSACQQGQPVWYSAWGYKEGNKNHARLTYNPYFDTMMSKLRGVMAQSHSPR